MAGPKVRSIIGSFRPENKDIDWPMAELIDNSFGEGAGNAMNFVAVLGKKVSTFFDDGEGIVDLDAITEAGSSGSADVLTEIGQFGWGAKSGLGAFGQQWTIETVRGDAYHKHYVDWLFWIEREKRTGVTQWPAYNAYRRGKSAAESPFPRGTMLTVEQPLIKRGGGDPAILKASLTRRYAAALRHGKTITVDYFGRETFVLDSTVAQPEFCQHESGSIEVDGKKLTAHWGVMTKPAAGLSGVHVAFGFRTIATYMMIGEHVVSPSFYAFVDLDREDWKSSLTIHKGRIEGDTELLEKLATLMGDLMKDAASIHNAVRLDNISAQLGDHILKLVPRAGGDKVILLSPGTEPPPHNKGKRGKGKGVKEDPNGDPKPAVEKETTVNGVHIAWEKLGPVVGYRTDFREGKLTVVLNTDNKVIKKIETSTPFRVNVAWPIICAAVADAIVNNEVLAYPQRRSLTILNNNMPLSDSDFRAAVYNELLLNAPDIKEPKAEAM